MILPKETNGHDCNKEGRGLFDVRIIWPFWITYRNRLMFLTALLLFLVAGCAHHVPIATDSKQALYMAAENGEDSLHRFAPVFRVYDYHHRYNRIGRPVAKREEDGRERITIDADQPTIYFEKRPFSTAKGSYTNLIYRVHFPSVPYSLIPFNLTAGNNPGLIIVITLNRQEEPVLVTSVHTCGCYKALVATTALSEEALPLKRQRKPDVIKVYGEHLPAVIDYRHKSKPRLLVDLRPGVHRVMDLEIIDAPTIDYVSSKEMVLKVPLEPSENLNRLRLNGHETSFYRQEGIMKGHVKGAVKPLETLLMSWMSLDLFIGTDKAYGHEDNPFYTSLKPWNRRKSDMNHFARFLEFWGWDL